MQVLIRKKITMASQVLNFAQAHPATDPSFVSVLTSLQTDFARAQALVQQQRVGQVAEHASVAERNDIRVRIEVESVRHLARVGAKAALGHPELEGVFRLPKSVASTLAFMSAVRTMLATATDRQDVLLPLGLGESFLADLTASIAAFDATILAGQASRESHVGALKDLLDVVNECVHLARVLDGLYRVQYRDNTELLGAWDSAFSSSGPFRSRHGDGSDPATAPVAPVAPVTPVAPSPEPSPVAEREVAA